MKVLIYLMAFLFLPVSISAQFITPDCSNLLVEEIYIVDDTSGLINITISNNCSNCMSGIDGCVYEELRVIRTVAPFDTIAASGCYCLFSPDNNSQATYTIQSNSPLPPPSDIRVSLMQCECDTIPFSPLLAVSPNSVQEIIEIYPNPATDQITLKGFDSDHMGLRIVNSLGRIVFQTETQISNDDIDISYLPGGLYVIEFVDDHSRSIQVSKFIKL